MEDILASVVYLLGVLSGWVLRGRRNTFIASGKVRQASGNHEEDGDERPCKTDSLGAH